MIIKSIECRKRIFVLKNQKVDMENDVERAGTHRSITQVFI